MFLKNVIYNIYNAIPVDKSKLNALEKISEPMGGKMIMVPITKNADSKQSFTTHGKLLDQGPSTRIMDSKVYVVQANGISNEDFSKKWQKYTHTGIKYDAQKDDYDMYPGIISLEAMRQDLDDAGVRAMYEDLGETITPVVSGENNVSMNLCEYVPNAFICEARNSFGKKPLELLSRVFPEATFDVLEIDHKNKGKCFMIQNGESVRMPDAYMTIDNYNSRDSFELSVDHTLKPVVESDRKLNAFERMRQERQNTNISAEMDNTPGVV